MTQVVLSILFLFAADMPLAQGSLESGSVSGVVSDQTGAVIRGGKVEVRNLYSGLTIPALTDNEGRYVVEGLPAGRYQVSAASPGFETSVRADIGIAPGKETVVDFSLSIGRHVAMIDVTAPTRTLGVEQVVPERARISDTASLLDGMPGVSLVSGGGVSSLPVIHGMDDDRVEVLVNGMSLESACTNHMDPPLSYIDPANVGVVSMVAGITPVSNGGDSIGGTIAVESAPAQFADSGEGFVLHGGISGYQRSNGGVGGGNATASAATENFRVAYTGSYVSAGNYKNGIGVMVKSAFYEATNHAVQFAFRRGSSLARADVGIQHIPQQGFVNARMDMTSNRARFANLRYENLFGWGKLDAGVYYEHSTQRMNILKDKVPGMNMPMNTMGTNTGYSFKAEISLSPLDILRIGNEFRRFLLDDWWPAVSAVVGNMGPDTLWNVRNGRRARFGTYVEWETKRGRNWTGLVGVRSDVVRMDTDEVAGYNMSTTATGSAAYYADATEFNTRVRKRLDENFDATVLARYEPAMTTHYEFGFARKTRSPSLYERYLWVKRSNMSVQMNGWFGDGNGYTGNLDLRPEVANTISATASWHDAARNWELRITPYYTGVRDYVDVDRCPVIVNSNGCTAAKLAATTGFVNLQFANHDATLYGMDVSGRVPLGGGATLGNFVLSGTSGYVRGRKADTGGNLYRTMPLNAKLSLEHERGNWSSAVEFQAVDAKEDVQAVRNELRTPGYTLINLRSSYEWSVVEKATLRLDAGVVNLGDTNYVLPLGGRYWVGDRTGSSSVPGMGRSYYGGLTLKF